VPRELHAKLLTTRSKLRRIALLRAVVSYEFSLRGRWPTKRYDTLAATEMEISKLLSHAVVVSEELGPAYSAALLRRTRGLDPLFLGDVIAVLQMCSTALQTGEALPQGRQTRPCDSPATLTPFPFFSLSSFSFPSQSRPCSSSDCSS
jgi:hypothetical protein